MWKPQFWPVVSIVACLITINNLGWGPYLSPDNCIRILWQKLKCIRILGHNWIHMDSDQNNWIHGFLQFWKKCILIPVFLMYSDSTVQKLKGFGFREISISTKTSITSVKITEFWYTASILHLWNHTVPCLRGNVGENKRGAPTCRRNLCSYIGVYQLILTMQTLSIHFILKFFDLFGFLRH